MTVRYSIIIPFYNAERFLQRSLDSVLRQGLSAEEYEVLLIDDGSTDGSAVVCERYCRQHGNFRLVQQTNSGVSAARNRGIDEAKGEYIILLDADDYWLDDGLKKALQCLNGRDDVDIVNYCSSYDFWEKKPIDDTIVLDGTGHDLILMRGIVSFCWLFAYRREFLDRHGIRFSPYIVGEDQLFTASVLLANPRTVATNADIVRYVVHEASATTKRSPEHAQRAVDDYLCSYADICAKMEQYRIVNKPDVQRKCVEELNFKKMFGFSRMLTSRYGRRKYAEVMRRCRETGFYPVVSKDGAGMKERLRVRLMNCVMRSFAVYKCAAWGFNTLVEPYVLRRMRTRLKK